MLALSKAYQLRDRIRFGEVSFAAKVRNSFRNPQDSPATQERKMSRETNWTWASNGDDIDMDMEEEVSAYG